ncbi:MAG: hypothetical protein IJQ85_02165 [Selenomonadaceae bacterium]|nr:hypothetical protein [Selenomonadaceae bacterium]
MGQRTSLKNFFAIICAATLIFTGCGENNSATSAEVKEAIPVKNSVTIQINGKNFSATLEDNPTARAFAEMIPLEVDMTELNGNEKYFYLDKDLPADSVSVKQIHAGDLMLFGSNCVVIFYKDFTTNYSYTRLGKLDNPADLEKTLGKGNVRVAFSKN